MKLRENEKLAYMYYSPAGFEKTGNYINGLHFGHPAIKIFKIYSFEHEGKIYWETGRTLLEITSQVDSEKRIPYGFHVKFDLDYNTSDSMELMKRILKHGQNHRGIIKALNKMKAERWISSSWAGVNSERTANSSFFFLPYKYRKVADWWKEGCNKGVNLD